MQRFGDKRGRSGGWQSNQRRQRRPEVVRGEAQFTGVIRQSAVSVQRVADGVRPGRQLGEQENGNEEEPAQRIHGAIPTPMISPGFLGVQHEADNVPTPIADLGERQARLAAPSIYNLKIQVAITK